MRYELSLSRSMSSPSEINAEAYYASEFIYEGDDTERERGNKVSHMAFSG